VSSWCQLGGGREGWASNKSFVAGFLAVDYVIGGFGGREDLDASLGVVDAVGAGAPGQLVAGSWRLRESGIDCKKFVEGDFV
jgi:hypothetical protein